MTKTLLFGKSYETIGSSSSNFIIKTQGDVKIQWGNKFIDLIKNGKIASNNDLEIFKLVSTEEEIAEQGIYLNPETKEIWVNIDNNIISLNGDSVSFSKEQKYDADHKNTALINIGFYYETFQDLQEAELEQGLVYVKNDKCLYLIDNGNIIKYVPESTEKFNDESIIIGQISEEKVAKLLELKKDPNVGTAINNFIGINNDLYNTTFKQFYPKYDLKLQTPVNYNDVEHDYIVPNLNWIKKIISDNIPIGSILLWNGDEIPTGWAICDGTNNTPNLQEHANTIINVPENTSATLHYIIKL